MRLFHFYFQFIFITGLNPSEEYPDPSPVPHTDSNSDLASSFGDGGSTGVTRLLDLFGFRTSPPLRTASVRQGGGYSGSGQNTGFRVVPQEVTHNGQEKSGSVISDLAHTVTHTHTDSRISFTQNVPTPGLRQDQSNTGVAYSDVPDDTDTPLGRSDALDTLHSKIFRRGDVTVMSSAPTATRSSLTALGNRASVTELQTSDPPGFDHVTDGRDAAVMSSAFTANEDRTKAHHSSETFRTNGRLNPDLSVIGGFLMDSVSDLQVSESNGGTYVSDGAVMSSTYTHTAGTGASRTNRLPRSTHVDEIVLNGTSSSLIADTSAVTHTLGASLSHHHIETSTLSDATTNPKKTTSSQNRDSTPTESSATHTVLTEDAMVPEQTTHRHMSDANTHTSTSPTPSDSDTSTGQGDPTTFNTLHTSFLTSLITTLRNDPTTTTPAGPYDTVTGTSSIPVSEEHTHNANANQVTEIYTRTSDSNYHVTSLSTDSKARLTTVTHLAPSSSSSSSSFRNDPVTPPVTPLSRLTSPPTHTLNTAPTNTPPANLYTNQTSCLQTTTPPAETRNPEHLTTSRKSQVVQRPDTTTHSVHTNTPAETYTPSTPVINPTSSRHTVTTKTHKERSHRGRVFIVEDQPAIIKVETFQVLLQVILEEDAPPNARLLEVEPFLQNVAGYQSQHVTWHSGPVLQSVVTFRTAETVTWLERAESLLQEAGLNPLPPQGVFVSGIRVKNVTVGGLHSDVCSWLFFCPPEFSCVSSEGNVTCRSVCHSEYCKNHGICVHQSGQNPVCQCPVGEDFWFMGQRCDLRMTRQRLAGVCFGVLATLAALMGLLSYLAVQRFKKMLLQAKAEQTQSSYRRFNHFDELSARFWRRSWPGSQDSLDHTAFSRSDELLHMRALDRPCCYHDDTLSIASTYPDSVTRLNTVYPHRSQYQWDMSMCSLADGVVDSGKASDLSVCSWPIEPIQWTPFPLLQQLRNTNTMKPSRPRSYCEGMELVGLEKSRTA